MGVLMQALGNNSQALTYYQRAVIANPNDANSHFNLALMLRAMGYQKDGDAQMAIALHLDPKLKDPAAHKPTPTPPPTPTPTPTAPKTS